MVHMKDQNSHTIKVVLLYLPVHLLAVALTWRDIRHRPANQLRGSKRLWRVVSALNTLGAGAYWLAGRRET
jgi:hypothetical protein